MNPNMMNPAFMNMMMNTMMNSQSQIFDPTKLDTRVKRTKINENGSTSKMGLYRSFPKWTAVKKPFSRHYDPGTPDKICVVEVVNEHSIDVVEKYSVKGVTNWNFNGANPAVLNIVSQKFRGNDFENNPEIRDEIINLRTTYCNTNGNINQYPVEQNSCIYIKQIYCIRKKFPNATFLPWNEIWRFGLITSAPIHKPVLDKHDKMNSVDLLKTLTNIETIFQCAIADKHHILILTPYGHIEDENPLDDIIYIYNFCIFKYGHKFSKIIFAIPPHYPKNIFEEYSTKIRQIQNLFSKIDEKYNELEMEIQLNNTNTQKETPHEQETEQTENVDNQMQNNQMFEMFKQMMATYNNPK
jgi:hypothetical protein